VKVLRPGIEEAFGADIELLLWMAYLIERTQPRLKRLKPVEVVQTFAATVSVEMDLRLEAASAAELRQNFAGDPTYRVPDIDWRRTAKRAMTQERLTGIPMDDRVGMLSAGLDIDDVLTKAAAAFFNQAFRDGYFHGDQHPGNMSVDAEANIVAVDFGIMGRLGLKERRFLAEILHGLITRDYRRTAAIHFEAGYVPATQSVEQFAQAMRAIGEPIHGRTAAEISMADLLGQLFAYTEVFDMVTRPELLLLQKTMVVVEGVARGLDPELNIWSAAEPIAKEWIETNYGVAGRLREAGEGAETVAKVLAEVPRLLEQAERTALALADMARGGLRLDDETIERLAAAQAREGRWSRWALWVGALALAATALWLMAPVG